MMDFKWESFAGNAACVIKLGPASGVEINAFYPFLTEVTAEIGRKPGAQATLKFESVRDPNGSWTIQDSGLFVPWTPVLLEADFGAGNTQEILRGYIRQVKVSYPQETAISIVEVLVQDKTLAMDRLHQRDEHGTEKEKTGDAAILQTIMPRYQSMGLKLHDQSSPGQSGLVLNQDETDIQFLIKRAEANGYELYQEEDKLYFGPMRLEGSAQATILVYAGQATNCVDFSIDDDGHKPDVVIFDVALEEGKDADSNTRQVTVTPNLKVLGKSAAESSQAGLQDFAWRMRRQDDVKEEQLTAVAQAKANQNALKIRATGTLDGSLYRHVLKPGHPVTVDGIGPHLAGTYYVDQVNHRFSPEGYSQEFALLRNAYGDDSVQATGKLDAVMAV